MKKLLNDSKNFVQDMILGIIAARGDKLSLLDDDFRMVIRKDRAKNKVGIVTGGGSGHLPLFLGYVGEGMLDGCAVGNVFASPSSSKMFDLIKYADTGKGVLCIYGNYGGDNMNFEMACENADFEDIKTAQIRVKDDIASASEDKKNTRRGVAGLVYSYKIAGAAADSGLELEEVVRVVNKVQENIRSMGVAMSACIVPEVGKPTFEIPEGKIEIGMGIHGEQGIEVKEMIRADEVAELILEKIFSEINLNSDDEVSVMINGLGATGLEEQYIVYKRVFEILDEKGIKIIAPHIGEFATSMEMQGLSITLLKLDEELKKYLLSTANTAFYTNYNK